ncbi:MAG TPA: hypothetical protein VLZ78_05640 [Terrimesophilobacter sp.]|nr:hypothetical protein [Terrimesophilobacter sp.]
MTILAILLTIVGVAASVASRDRSPLLVCGVTGMGAVMIGAMLVPGFSHLAGASATIALALVVSAGAAAGARGRARRSNATAVTVVDLVFMSIAMLLVPAHTTLPRFVTPIDAAADLGSHGPVAGGLMVWLTLAAWALSAVVLILPALRERAPEGSYHIACSASMIAAMIAMAV